MTVEWFAPSIITPVAGRAYLCDILCTTEAELPMSGVIVGDDCYCKDTKKTWTVTAIDPDVIWEQTGGQSVGNVPTGAIVMWSGTLAAIPSGWVLCDGQSGTPDLRDRFVKGAASGQNPGATGGAATHQHTYSQVLNHVHPITDPGHSHALQRYPTTTGASSGFTADTSMSGTPAGVTLVTQVASTGITGTQNPTGGVAQGTTDAGSSEPPYYAIAFIMKT